MQDGRCVDSIPEILGKRFVDDFFQYGYASEMYFIRNVLDVLSTEMLLS